VLSDQAEVARHDWRMLISGELVEARTGRRFGTDNPATEEPLATVPDAGAADVDAAVRAGEEASRHWARVGVRERARVLRAMAEILRRNTDELALLDALDCGHPVTAMAEDVRMAADTLESYADWALQLGGEVVPVSSGHLNYTTRRPYGVVVRIVPYNHPIMFAASAVGGPLLAGNAVVLKPAHQTPLSALRMGELLRDVLPAGLLAILSGAGPETGELLVGPPVRTPHRLHRQRPRRAGRPGDRGRVGHQERHAVARGQERGDRVPRRRPRRGGAGSRAGHELPLDRRAVLRLHQPAVAARVHRGRRPGTGGGTHGRDPHG
jgi:hypothetical protein